MEAEIQDIIVILEDLIVDLSHQAESEVNSCLDLLKKDNIDVEILLQVQDKLEVVTSMPNIDSYARSEIYNILTVIENLL